MVGERFLSGSNLSVASTLNNVSILPTMAMVKATIQTLGLASAVKSGSFTKFLKSQALSSAGRLTNCCFTNERDSPAPLLLNQ